MWRIWVLGLIAIPLILVSAIATSGDQIDEITKHGCKDRCGDVTVPYPFGIGSPDCAINEYFLLNCTDHGNGSGSGRPSHPQLLIGNIPVRRISTQNGTITIIIEAAYYCFKEPGGGPDGGGALSDNSTFSLQLNSDGFLTFSATGNVFTVIGCDTTAMVINYEFTYGVSCLSLCSERVVHMRDDNPCLATGCCQTSIPKSLDSLNISVESIYNHSEVFDYNPCGYAFLAEKDSLRLSDWKLSRPPPSTGQQPYYTSDVLIEWVVNKHNCTNVCADNNTGICHPSNGGNGYRCSCKPGFQGNPYLQNGCKDINECEDPRVNPCHGSTCHNTIGNYTCSCPLGMYGDGKIRCHGFPITTIVGVIGASISLIITATLIYVIVLKRRRDKNFRENGGTILKHQRVIIFSKAQLQKATKNYDDCNKIGEGGFGSVYKGVLEDGSRIAVKKPKGTAKKGEMTEDFKREMETVTTVNHKNVVKLIGMCLETKFPMLVYEFISNGNLSQHIHEKRSEILKTWKHRLRIAAEAALALDYLHSLADPPVIHGDIKPMNILLDDKYTAKIADFGTSVLVSPGHRKSSKVSTILGTLGYLDPEYLMTGILTAESDVYSFGIVLIELITGKMPTFSVQFGEKMCSITQYVISSLEADCLSQILDFQVVEGEMCQVEEVARLAIRCVNGIGLRRPKMKHVSDQLASLTASIHNNEETQLRMHDEPPLMSFPNYATAPVDLSQIHIITTPLEMEKYYTDSMLKADDRSSSFYAP